MVSHVSPSLGTRRTGCIQSEELPIECQLDVFELDIPVNLRRFYWPNFLPRIDGVVVCYDASDPLSFKPIEIILSE